MRFAGGAWERGIPAPLWIPAKQPAQPRAQRSTWWWRNAAGEQLRGCSDRLGRTWGYCRRGVRSQPLVDGQRPRPCKLCMWTIDHLCGQEYKYECRSPLRTNSSLTIWLNSKQQARRPSDECRPPPVECFFSRTVCRTKRGGCWFTRGGQFSQPSVREQVVKTETRGLPTHIKCGAKYRTAQQGLSSTRRAWREHV